MKLINQGLNPYANVQSSILEKNSIHPVIPICPVNRCGTCSYPVAVALC
jgi:hypothetical protein